MNPGRPPRYQWTLRERDARGQTLCHSETLLPSFWLFCKALCKQKCFICECMAWICLGFEVIVEKFYFFDNSRLLCHFWLPSLRDISTTRHFNGKTKAKRTAKIQVIWFNLKSMPCVLHMNCTMSHSRTYKTTFLVYIKLSIKLLFLINFLGRIEKRKVICVNGEKLWCYHRKKNYFDFAPTKFEQINK